MCGWWERWCCSVKPRQDFWKARSREVASGVSTPAPGGWNGIVRLVCPDAITWGSPGKMQRGPDSSGKAAEEQLGILHPWMLLTTVTTEGQASQSRAGVYMGSAGRRVRAQGRCART